MENCKSVTAKGDKGNSLAVQHLGLSAFIALVLSSIPGQGTKILQAMRHSREKKELIEMSTSFYREYFFPGAQRRLAASDPSVGKTAVL